MKLDWTDAIKCHYEKHWKVPGQVSSLPPGPIGQVLPSFKVLEFPRHPGRSLWTYATVGMSLPSDERHIELHMFTQNRSESCALLLAMVAYYHRTGEQLGLWHTVNFGCPWLALSECTCGLISLPYLDGPALEDLETEHGLVKCYWLIPITENERSYKMNAGLEALEQAFEESSFEYWNPARKSVV